MRTVTINTDRALSAAEHVREAMLKCSEVLPNLPQRLHALLIKSLADRIHPSGRGGSLEIQMVGFREIHVEETDQIAKHVSDAVSEAERIFKPATPFLSQIVFLIAAEFIVDKDEDRETGGDEDGIDSRLPAAREAAFAALSRLKKEFISAKQKRSQWN